MSLIIPIFIGRLLLCFAMDYSKILAFHRISAEPEDIFSLVNRALHVWPMPCSAHCGVKSTAIGIPALRILIIVIWAVSEQDLNRILFSRRYYVMPKQEYNED